MNLNNRGFSLTELLVAVAIVAILLSLAIPSYSSYINKSKINIAQSDVSALALVYENQYQRILAYPLADHENTAELRVGFSNWKYGSEDTDFSFSSTNASSSTYTLNATGLSGALTDCVISLTHEGAKTISGCAEYAGSWL